MKITESQKTNSVRMWRNFVTNLEKNKKIYVSTEKIKRENEFLKQEINDLNTENKKLLNKISELEGANESCNQKASPKP